MTIGTVSLKVADLDKQSRFYQDTIGLQVHRQEADTLYLGTGGADLLALTQHKGNYYQQAVGLYHFALLLPTRYDLALTLKHFAETQTPLHGLSDHLVSEAVYLADPEGNGIEIYADRAADTWFKNGQLQMDTIAINVPNLLQTLDGKPAVWQGLPAGTIIGHIHLHVSAIPTTEQFYTGVLGLDVMFHMDTASFLAYDRYHHHIGANIWRGRKPAPADALGLDHFILQVEQVRLDQILAAVNTNNIPYQANDDGYRLHDPSGIAIQLIAKPA